MSYATEGLHACARTNKNGIGKTGCLFFPVKNSTYGLQMFYVPAMTESSISNPEPVLLLFSSLWEKFSHAMNYTCLGRTRNVGDRNANAAWGRRVETRQGSHCPCLKAWHRQVWAGELSLLRAEKARGDTPSTCQWKAGRLGGRKEEEAKLPKCKARQGTNTYQPIQSNQSQTPPVLLSQTVPLSHRCAGSARHKCHKEQEENKT